MTNQDQSYRVGSGRSGVVLLHGLAGSPVEMRYIANGLAREGYNVYCPQLAGHGSRAQDLRTSTWQDWFRSAEEALLTMAAECDTVVVGGLSTGAVLALLLAAKHPGKVAGLALYSPTLWLNGPSIPWYARLFPIVPTKGLAGIFSFPAPKNLGIKDARLREFIKNSITSNGGNCKVVTPGGAVIEHRWVAAAARQALHKITQPVLILHAREDGYASLDNATYLQENLKGSVDLVVLEDSYHMATVDRQRGVVLERTAAFAGRIFSVFKDQLGETVPALAAAA
ncbi:MAG: alpha/beta fold hydrolase [Hyphomicrobium sp.]